MESEELRKRLEQMESICIGNNEMLQMLCKKQKIKLERSEEKKEEGYEIGKEEGDEE